MTYKFDFNEVRSSKKEGKRYARVRAIANGPDSYNSIFTRSARESLIEQLKSNGVKTNALHKNAIDQNMRKYLKDRLKQASGEEVSVVQSLLGNLSNGNFPIGKVVDASFVDDNTIEAVIVENTALKGMGAEQTQYLDSAWSMIEDGVLSGVSVVFNDVKSFEQDGKLFIDNLNLLGLDFVDRPAHTETRVLETFMRAAQDSVEVADDEESTDEEPEDEVEIRMAEEKPVEVKPQVVDVDEIVEKAEAKIEEKAKAADEQKEKEDAIRKEAQEKIDALEEEKKKLEENLNEAVDIAKIAVEKVSETVVKTDNPHVERIAENAEKETKDPLQDKSMGELFKLRDEVSG